MGPKRRTISKVIDSNRCSTSKKEHRLETIADYLFLSTLAGIIVIILLIAFNIIK